jgi:beta-glucosidase/6-phospho-beta-glucosidase/beta-galactosidase
MSPKNNTLPDVPSFASFLMAGFECTYSKAEDSRRLDLLAATKHDLYCREDYGLIKEVGMQTVREGLSWSQIDQGDSKYDFNRFEQMMKIGKEKQIQQIWDLNHFDYPEDLDPFSMEFVDRFSSYAVAAIRILRHYQSGTLFIVPLNEISFFAWIGADMGWWAPYKKGRKNGFAFKKQLVKAAISAMKAIWSVDKDVRFIQVDPFMRRMALAPARKTAEKHVSEFNDVIRFQAWDMLCGKECPELGGAPEFLDIIGVNYYIHNQEWVISQQKRKVSHQLMDWNSSDRVSFAEMLAGIYERYHRPMLVSETGSYGDLRNKWWSRTLAEVHEGLIKGLPICGVCAYPTVDRPNSAGFLLPKSGLWDFDQNDQSCHRIPHVFSLETIKKYNQQFRQILGSGPVK